MSFNFALQGRRCISSFNNGRFSVDLKVLEGSSARLPLRQRSPMGNPVRFDRCFSTVAVSNDVGVAEDDGNQFVGMTGAEIFHEMMKKHKVGILRAMDGCF